MNRGIPASFAAANRQLREEERAGRPEPEGSSWRKLIAEEMAKHGEDWGDAAACTLSDEGLDVVFWHGFGHSEGAPFTLWTARRVYFPVVYDGAESVGSAPRDPSDEACDHVGGE
jgi:hypothetical protein